jgi:hypothetical protein
MKMWMRYTPIVDEIYMTVDEIYSVVDEIYPVL